MPELIEAGARSGDLDVAASTPERLSNRTRLGTDWALGMETQSGTLISDDQAADELYLEAIDRVGCRNVVVHSNRPICSGIAFVHPTTAGARVLRARSAVPPLGGTVVAGDQPHPVQTAEVRRRQTRSAPSSPRPRPR
jgi:hypothetical protein